MKRIMVDLSATLLHHGHTRLIKQASREGAVIVALTTDEEILSKKGYEPELAYQYREEILLSIKYVQQVVPSPWLIDQSFLKLHNIDYLVHGHDNSNPINKDKLIILPRTEGISSSLLRQRAAKIYNEKKA